MSLQGIREGRPFFVNRWYGKRRKGESHNRRAPKTRGLARSVTIHEGHGTIDFTKNLCPCLPENHGR